METLELVKKLIKIDSTDPGVYEFEMEKFLKGYLEQIKTSDVTIHESEVSEGRKNLMAVLNCNGEVRAPDLVLISHMDTVVIGSDWTMPSFDAIEKDGKIYGRGSTDMKSGLAVALKTFEYAVKNVDAKKLKRNFKVIFTVDEEADMRGVEKAITDKWVDEKSFVADLEPTDKMIQVSHKGRFWVKLSVKGRTAHASRPELGIDANACLSEIISYIRKEIAKLPVDEEIGRTTVTFGMMSGGYEPYVVPDSAYVTMDFRLAPPIFNKDIVKIIDDAILYAKSQISNDAIITYEITGDRAYVKKNDNSKLLLTMKEVIENIYENEKNDDYRPVVTSFSGYTDTAVIASVLNNRETLSYGPGSLALAHKPDEYVEIKDIERCEKVYKSLIDKLLL